MDPNYALTYYHRGIAKFEMKRYKAAVKDYSRAIRLNPKAVFFYYHRGIAEFELERFGKAKRNLRKVLKLANQDGETSLIAKIKKRRKDMKRKK